MPLARVWATDFGFTLCCQFSCIRDMLFQSLVVSSTTLPLLHFLFVIFQYTLTIHNFTLGWGNKSGIILRMLDIWKDYNHVTIFLIHIQFFLKSFFVLPLASFSLLSPPLFLELLQHMWAFGRRKIEWLIERIVCLLWGAFWGPSGLHKESFDPGNVISSRCFPHSHLSAVSLLILCHKNKCSRTIVTAHRFPEHRVTENWHLI